MMNTLSTITFASLSASAATPPAGRPFLDVFQDPELALALLARLHPLFVHFPIALFVVAALAEILRPNRQSEKPSPTAFACVTLGAIAGALAAWSGWVHADLSPPVARMAETVKLHRWTGVAVGGLGVLAFLTGALAHWGSLGSLTRIYRAAIVLAGLGVGFSAHLGATLIYGEGYLTQVFEERSSSPARGVAPASAGPAQPAAGSGAPPLDLAPAEVAPAEKDPSPPAGSEAAAEQDAPSGPLARLDPALELVEESWVQRPVPVSFASEVLPIFVAHCIDCHGPRKQKAGLRLDAEEYVFGGDPEFWVIARGNADASELQRRIELPADDPDLMPARGDRLSAAQVAQVRRWIDAGADFGGAGVGEIAVPAEALPTETQALAEPEPETMPAREPEPEAVATDPVEDVAVEDVDAREAALAALTELGVWARPVAVGWNALDVDFRRRADLGDQALASLVPIASQVTALDLTGSGVTAAGLAHLSAADHLEFLVLRDTQIGDDAISTLAALPALERLNLVGTEVTDAGAAELASASQLRRLFVWNSAITAAGAAALQAERPELEIVTGD